MSAHPITLYDLPSKEPNKAWSLNPWKTRLILNYKDLSYKTEWTEYPDIRPKFESFGIPAQQPDQNNAIYTIPVIKLPDGTYVMNSQPISQKLESLYPNPSLHLDSPYLERIQTVLPQALGPLGPIFAPKVHRLLPQRSAEYFNRTRQVRFKMTLDELENGPNGGRVAWEAAEPHLKEIAGMLKEDSSGPYFMGKEVSYADFMLVSFMRMFERIGQLEHVLAVDKEAFGGVYQGCKKWMERDDH